MSDSPVTFTLDDDVAIIDIDDGKANAISFALLDDLFPAVDRAVAEAKAVVIVGREGRFSGGFDLSVVGGDRTMELMGRGGGLAITLWSLPIPVVLAVTGHTMAMGAVLLCCADYRVGADGPFKLGLNEVRINLPLPPFAVEVARARLNPTHFSRATQLAEIYDPAGAVEAGYLDEVVPADRAPERAVEVAHDLAASLQSAAFVATRRTVHGAVTEQFAGMIPD